jgi:RNA polymerase sigma factor (sigma-70 family)
MEVSALTYPTTTGRHGRHTLLRLQSDEHLIKLIRAGHDAAFEVMLSRYQSRLLSFCRHLLGSREDAEDVLQEVFSAAYNAIHADEREINVRPWLYRIARNRCLNHLRRTQAIGVDSMDVLFAAHGETTADKVHQREDFRQLVGDIHGLPESQRTALILRELDALPYEQIAEAMETTVSSVKSLLVRARVSLAEASEARLLSCAEVRTELAEFTEGLVKRPSPPVRRHIKSCERCGTFNKQLKKTNRALAAMVPAGPLAIWKAGLLSHFGGHAGGGAAAASSSAAGGGAVAGASASTSSAVSAGAGALATKAAVGLALAAVITAAGVSSSGRGTTPFLLHGRPVPSTASRAQLTVPAHSLARTGVTSSEAGRRHTVSQHRTASSTAHPHQTVGASAPVAHQLPAAGSPATKISPTAAAGGPSLSATQTTAVSSPATSAPASSSATPAKPGSPPASSAPGTASAGGGTVSSAAGTVAGVAGAIGAGLNGTGTSGSGQSAPSATPTLTVPLPTSPSGS